MNKCRCESYWFWNLKTKAETAVGRYGAAFFGFLPVLILLAVAAAKNL